MKHQDPNLQSTDSTTHFSVRFRGHVARVEEELARARTSNTGNEEWCETFRGIHEEDFAVRAPLDLLHGFANSAPSEFLKGYVLGIAFSRERSSCADLPALVWVALAQQTIDSMESGMAFGCAFMSALTGPSTHSVAPGGRRRRSLRRPR